MTAPAGAATAGAGERVLVVDDEPDIVALVAYHLARAGYRVSTAATGDDALRATREERPALVVLDLMLPGMSGFDVLEQLRAGAATRHVWEAAPDIQTRTVDMHVRRLRAKLGAAGDLIEAVRGFGYRLRAPAGRGA